MRQMFVRLAVVVVVLAFATPVLSASAAGGTPSITVSPSVGVTSGTKLRFVAHHLPPNTSRAVFECNLAFPTDGLAACNLPKSRIGNTDSKGRMVVHGKAILGPTGTDGGVCDADHSCLIVVFYKSGAEQPVTTPISFAESD